MAEHLHVDTFWELYLNKIWFTYKCKNIQFVANHYSESNLHQKSTEYLYHLRVLCVKISFYTMNSLAGEAAKIQYKRNKST